VPKRAARLPERATVKWSRRDAAQSFITRARQRQSRESDHCIEAARNRQDATQTPPNASKHESRCTRARCIMPTCRPYFGVAVAAVACPPARVHRTSAGSRAASLTGRGATAHRMLAALQHDVPGCNSAARLQHVAARWNTLHHDATRARWTARAGQ
jgi:hypothetical protein